MEKLSGIIANSGRQVLEFNENERPRRLSEPTLDDHNRILRPPPEPLELPTPDGLGTIRRGSILDIRI